MRTATQPRGLQAKKRTAEKKKQAALAVPSMIVRSTYFTVVCTGICNIYCHFVFQAPRAVAQLPSFLVGSVHISVVLSFAIHDLFWIGSSIGVGGGADLP